MDKGFGGTTVRPAIGKQLYLGPHRVTFPVPIQTSSMEEHLTRYPQPTLSDLAQSWWGCQLKRGKSWNHRGWKRPLRSSSPTVNPTPDHEPEVTLQARSKVEVAQWWLSHREAPRLAKIWTVVQPTGGWAPCTLWKGRALQLTPHAAQQLCPEIHQTLGAAHQNDTSCNSV